MSDRITERMLQGLVDDLNRLMGENPAAMTRQEDDRWTWNVGTFMLSHAYGGVELERVSNTSGGVGCPLGSGHVTKRELYYRLRGYLQGLRDMRDHLQGSVNFR
jgi:hypothetical protein